MTYELVFETVKGEIRFPMTKDLLEKVFEQLRTADWSTRTFHCNGTIVNLSQTVSVRKVDKE